jgi:hypothetical protein
MGAGDLDVFARRDWPIQALDASQYPYEMMVTQLRSGPAADREHWTDAFLKGDNIRAWQNSTPEGKVFLAYIGLSGLSVIYPDCARGLAAGLDLEREMIRLLQEIRAYIDAKGLGPSIRSLSAGICRIS